MKREVVGGNYELRKISISIPKYTYIQTFFITIYTMNYYELTCINLSLVMIKNVHRHKSHSTFKFTLTITMCIDVVTRLTTYTVEKESEWEVK